GVERQAGVVAPIGPVMVGAAGVGEPVLDVLDRPAGGKRQESGQDGRLAVKDLAAEAAAGNHRYYRQLGGWDFERGGQQPLQVAEAQRGAVDRQDAAALGAGRDSALRV